MTDDEPRRLTKATELKGGFEEEWEPEPVCGLAVIPCPRPTSASPEYRGPTISRVPAPKKKQD
jgi:hypothetical protein